MGSEFMFEELPPGTTEVEIWLWVGTIQRQDGTTTMIDVDRERLLEFIANMRADDETFTLHQQRITVSLLDTAKQGTGLIWPHFIQAR